jgi:CRISPR-associated protein Csb1
VKNDHVNPSWPKKEVERGFGNIPFARDEFTAKQIKLYVNLDLAQIRGYGLSKDVERLLILLALYKLRILLDDTLRLRTACDLQVDPEAAKPLSAKLPSGFTLPDSRGLTDDLKDVIRTCKDKMPGDIATFNDEMKTRKEGEDSKGTSEDDIDATDDSDS